MEEKEKALLVGVNINDRKYFNESIEELKNLTEACDIIVAGEITQNLPVVNNPLYIGSGKVSEVKAYAKELNADLIIFNNELSPSQLRNLQRELDFPILDRTSLILEIFAKRAQTKEAKLQVEVARLKYMLPRLVGLHSSLGRQGGSAGVSNKGSGEKKLELDRRKIEDKLTELNKELEELSKERDIQKRQRKSSAIPLISLVGYTNAGKSTILNSLVDIYQKDDSKKVLEKDMLFATLETSVRKIELENNKSFLISDTVGFISELPHNLIKAFRSTLDEIKEADIILHVVDVADDNKTEHIEVTNETLKSLNAQDIPMFYVFNKADLITSEIPIVEENAIYMSASKKIGIDELINIISDKVFSNYIKCEMLIPYEKGSIISYLNENASIIKTEYLEEGTKIMLECRVSDSNRYKEYIVG